MPMLEAWPLLLKDGWKGSTMGFEPQARVFIGVNVWQKGYHDTIVKLIWMVMYYQFIFKQFKHGFQPTLCIVLWIHTCNFGNTDSVELELQGIQSIMIDLWFFILSNVGKFFADEL